MNTVLVPLDGSPLSEAALPFAVSIARRHGARVVLIRACLPLASLYRGNASARRIAAARQSVEIEQAQAAIDVLTDGLREEGADAEGHVYPGNAAYVILEQASAHGADLIVMSTHGRSATVRFVLGSVADEVLRRSEIPLVLVPPACHKWGSDSPGRILVTLDGSQLAEEVIQPALRFADSFHAELLLVRVVEPGSDDVGEATGYLEQVAGHVRQPGRTVRIHVRSGSPLGELAEVASDQSADLIAMATHGRGGLARMVLGSVATATIEHVTQPVLVVRPAALRESP